MQLNFQAKFRTVWQNVIKGGNTVLIERFYAKCLCCSLAYGSTICNLLSDEWHVEKWFKLVNIQSSNSAAMSWRIPLKQQVACQNTIDLCAWVSIFNCHIAISITLEVQGISWDLKISWDSESETQPGAICSYQLGINPQAMPCTSVCIPYQKVLLLKFELWLKIFLIINFPWEVMASNKIEYFPMCI